MKKCKKRELGNYIFIIGLFGLLMLNLNSYKVYQTISYYNYLLVAVILTAVFVCYTDVRSIYKDKLLWFVTGINVLVLINLFITGTGKMAILVIYSFTMGLYLTTKIVFNKKQMYIIMACLAFFFFYWTVDVKGYYKGYSINFGGLVLITGFVFVIMLAEYAKYLIYNSKSENVIIRFVKKCPYVYILFEMLLFFGAYKIISWYRSRTAFMALFVLAVLVCIPKKILANIKVSISIFILSIIGMLMFPYAYIMISNSGILAGREIFYKPVIGNRAEIYSHLIQMIRLRPIVGNGTIYIENFEPFRDGLLDACNGGLQIFTVYGLIVGMLTLALVVWVIINLIKDMNINLLTTVPFVGMITLIVASYSESCIFTAPFILAFPTCLYIMKSFAATDVDLVKNSEDVLRSALTDKAFKEKAIPVLCVTVMVLFMYLILGPIEIFYSNYYEFKFNTSDYIWRFVIAFIVISVVITLLMAMLPRAVSKVYCCIMLAVGIISYIQYMFINGDLVDDNGNFAVVGDLGGRMMASILVTVIVFVAITLIATRFKRIQDKVIIYASLFVTLIMCVAVMTIGINLLMLDNKPYDKVVYDASDEFNYADGNNIIVIVLDSFGRAALKKEYDEYPESAKVFSDFTFYENEDSKYYPTFPSLIHFLTGVEYDGSEKPVFDKTAFTSERALQFYEKLHESGYYVSLNSADLLEEDYMVDICDNIKASKMSVNHNDIAGKMLRMSVYRYVPYFLKGYFEVYLPTENNVIYELPQTCTANDTFLARIREWGIHKDSKYSKKFSFTHLHGAHTPYRNDAQGNSVEWGSVSAEEAVHGLIYIMEEYFNMLKAAGVYDEAVIIVMADHGGGKDQHDSIFFKKDSFETHEGTVISDEMLTHCDFQDIVLKSIK